MAQVYMGRRITSATTNGQNLITGTAYGQSIGAATSSQEGRIIKIGGWIGGTTPPENVRWSAYTHNAVNNTPNLLMGNTDLGSLVTSWISGSGGANFERSIASVEPGFGASEVGILVRQGDAIQIVLQSDETTRAAYATLAGAVLSNRAIAGTTPPNPFAFTSQSALGRGFNWYVLIEQNRTPVLSNVGPDGVVLNTLNPIFSFRFTDQDRADGYNDYPTRAIVRVYENQGGAYVFVGAHTEVLPNPGAGTSFVDVSFDYQGPSLTMERSYVYTLEVQDEIGGISGTVRAGTAGTTTTPDGSLNFDLSAKGTIATSTPSGKQTSLTPGNISGIYSHPSASPLDKVQLRLLKRNNTGQYTVLETSAIIDIVNVNSGSLATIPWGQPAFAPLTWGNDYAVQWKLTAVDSSVSDWSASQFFWTNKIPQQSLLISPEGSEVFTVLPELFAYVFDDDDTPAGSLTGEFEITRPYTLVNPGFETDILNWTYSEESSSYVQTLTRTTVSPIHSLGSLSVAMSATPNNTTSYYLMTASDRFACVAGYLYSAGAYVRGNTATVSIAAVGLAFYNSGGTQIGSVLGITESPVDNTTVKTVIASAVAPAGAVTFAPVLMGRNNTALSTWTHIWDSVAVDSGVAFIRAGTHVGNNLYRYQTVAADALLGGTHTIRARGFDTNNYGPWSAPANFVYASGIVAAFTSPSAGATLTTSAPQFTWSVSSGGPQTRYRLDVLDADTGENIYDSLWVNSAATSFKIPAGYVGNSGSFIARLWLDNGTVASLVDSINFQTSYTSPAAPVNFNAAVFFHEGEPEASSIIMTWDAVSTAPENLERFEIYADEGNGPNRIAIFEGAIGASVSSFVYPFPRSGVDIEFTARQIVQQNNGALQNGLWAQSFARVDLTAIYLVSVVSPMDRRLGIRYWQETTESPLQVQAWATPAGALDYVEVPSSLAGRDLSLTAQFIDLQDESGITAQQQKDTFDALFDGILVDNDRRIRDILCYRDPRQYKHFTRISGNPNHRHGKGTVRYTTSFGLRRVAYTEGL